MSPARTKCVLNEQPDGSIFIEIRGGDQSILADLDVTILKGESFMGVPYSWLLARARDSQQATLQELGAAAV